MSQTMPHCWQINLQGHKAQQAMEEHSGTLNARKHEQAQNYSLASMSTIGIVIICKTKNVSSLWKKGALARHVLGKNRFMPARSPPPSPSKKD